MNQFLKLKNLIKIPHRDDSDDRAATLYFRETADIQIFFANTAWRERFIFWIERVMSKMEIERPNLDDNRQEVHFNYWKNEGADSRTILGRGGFGTVYKGFDTEDGKPLAIKEILPFDLEGRSNTQELLEEIKLHSALSHKHIVKYIGARMENGVFKIVTEYVRNSLISI